MIPAEAVEAAMREFDPAWDSAPSEWREYFLSRTRAALEAAAPYMMAGAFEEAAEAWGEAASWSDGRPSAEQVQRWLRSRANSFQQP